MIWLILTKIILLHAGNPIDDILPCTLLDEEDPNHEPDFNLGDVPNVEAVAEIFEDTSISSDALSYSQEDDHDRFNPGLSEEGPGEPSLLSISGIPNVTAQADQPISEWRGERDLRNGDQEQPSSESTENEPTFVVVYTKVTNNNLVNFTRTI